MEDVKMKKRWIAMALLAVEVLLLIFMAHRCFFGERYIAAFQESEGLPVGETKIPLPRGSYLITLDYTAEEDWAYCQMVAETSHGRHQGEEVALLREKNQRTVEFYLNEPTDQFSVEPASYLQEIPAVHISSVMIAETRRMDMRDCFWFFAFLFFLILCCLQKRSVFWNALMRNKSRWHSDFCSLCFFHRFRCSSTIWQGNRIWNFI